MLSKRADKKLKAKHPGKRTSDSGNVYYENRPNRSDKNRTKKLAKGGVLSKEYVGESLSHGTLNEDHLYEAFMDFLKPRAKEFGLVEKLNKIEKEWDEANQKDDQETKSYIINEDLFDILNNIAPEGTYFGSHPGDGSDMGFWSEEDSEEFSEGGDVSSLKEKIEKILARELPGFYTEVKPYKTAITESNTIAIKAAVSGKKINEVTGQLAQLVSLSLNVDDMELSPQVFGGMGGQKIYLIPDKENPKEKYLAMAGYKIDFRKPRPNEKSVLAAIEKFFKAYKKALIDNKDRLMYKNEVDYDSLLSEKYSEGGKPLGSTGLFEGGGKVSDDQVEEATRQYIYTALWSSSDDDGESLDMNYDIGDIDENSIKGMENDMRQFLEENYETIEESGLIYEQVAHDFWLTRNHHGAGFFDRHLDPEIEKKLMDASHSYHEVDLYVGDDGKIYASGSGKKGEFSEGGKPLGSTGLFEKGGPVVAEVTEVPAQKGYKNDLIIVGVNAGNELVTLKMQYDKYFSISGSTLRVMTDNDAKKESLEYWESFFEDNPDQLKDMNERMGKKFRSSKSAAKYVIQEDGEYHGVDVDWEISPVEYKNKEYVFIFQSGGQVVDELNDLKLKFLPEETIEKIKTLWDKFHLEKDLPEGETIPYIAQDKEKTLNAAIEFIESKNSGKYEDGGKPLGSTLLKKGGKITDPHQVKKMFDENFRRHIAQSTKIAKNSKGQYAFSVEFKDTHNAHLAARYMRDKHVFVLTDDKRPSWAEFIFSSEKFEKPDSYQDGGKPLGSTGLFAHGGSVSKDGKKLEGSNLLFYGFRLDVNGNKVIVLSFPDEKKFSIQTNGNLPTAHSVSQGWNRSSTLSADDNRKISSEAVEYIRKYGSETQKGKLKSSNYSDGGKPIGSTGMFADGGTAAWGAAVRIPNIEAASHAENFIPFRGNNLEGKILDNGDYAVLSYGYYPIWYYSKKEGKWYGNKDKYSVTTAKQMSQSKPTHDAVLLSNADLLEKMKSEEARFDLGGLMIDQLYPANYHDVPTDNTLIAHSGASNTEM